MLEISVLTSVDQNINLAASIQLKNMVEAHWQFSSIEEVQAFFDEDEMKNRITIIFTEEDREFVKGNMINSVTAAPSYQVLAQLEEVIYHVSNKTLPEGILPQISELVNSSEERNVFGGLTALKAIVKKFEYSSKAERVHLNEIASHLFPKLENTLVALLEVDTEEGVRAKAMIVETIKRANQMGIIQRYLDFTNLDQLIEILKKIILHELPADLTTFSSNADDLDKMNKHPQWELKTQTMDVLFKIACKFQDPETCEEEFVGHCKHAIANYHPFFMEMSLNILKGSVENYFADKVVCSAIKFQLLAVRNQFLKATALENVDEILAIVLKHFKLSPQDLETFESDPVGYVRSLFDISGGLYVPKNQALDLMIECLERKPEKMRPFLNQCFEAMEATQDPIELEALLLTIGHLAPIISQEAEVLTGVEQLLQKHAHPHLTNPIGYLRSRACWIYGEYANNLSDRQGMVDIAEKIYINLKSDELPVQVTAACSLYKLLRVDEVKDKLESGLPQIIESYLTVIQEIDQDELITALERVVEVYDSKIEPFAYELCEKLVNSYRKVVISDIDDRGESMMAASSYVSALRRIIDAVHEHKEVILKIETLIYPIILHSLTPAGIEYIEDTLDCATLCVFHAKQITPEMWTIFTKTLMLIPGGEGAEEGGMMFDFVSYLQAFYQNCIKYDPETFLTGTNENGENYFAHLMRTIPEVLTISRGFGEGMQEGCAMMKLIQTLLENLTGRLDAVIPDFIKLIHSELNMQQGKAWRSMLLQTFSMLFFYNSELTFQALEAENLTDEMLKTWFSNLVTFRKCYELKRVIFGLAAILKNDPRKAPALFSSELSQVMNTVLLLAQTHVKSKQKELDQDDEEDADDFNPEEYRNTLLQIQKIRSGEGGLVQEVADELEDDLIFDDNMWMSGDLGFYESPIDVDPVLAIRDLLSSLETEQKEVYDVIVGSLQPEQISQFQTYFVTAEQQVAKEKEDQA